MIDFDQYVKKGLIKKQNTNFPQIERQVLRAEKDLIIFSVVLENDPEWAATIAYQAMLRSGRALLFSYGYLPSDGQQHKTVVEITGKILGDQYEIVIQYFEKLRKKRNTFFYDSIDSGNLGEARKAADIAKKLIVAIKENIQRLNPQMKFLPFSQHP